ncbi:hypothetical protein [Candidatus Nanohalococcus occultus]|uniref:hypothetical protein n=1 Tax=Candidatus Nanohalococcus occultus TaxID=2978047 RepID=UPI0039E1FC08
MTDNSRLDIEEIGAVAKKINSELPEVGIESPEEAIAVLEIAKSLQIRKASSYDVALGQHHQVDGDTDEE